MKHTEVDMDMALPDPRPHAESSEHDPGFDFIVICLVETVDGLKGIC